MHDPKQKGTMDNRKVTQRINRKDRDLKTANPSFANTVPSSEKATSDTETSKGGEQPSSGAVQPAGIDVLPPVPLTISDTVVIRNTVEEPAGAYAVLFADALAQTIAQTPSHILQDAEEIIIEPRVVIQELPPTIRMKFKHERRPR